MSRQTRITFASILACLAALLVAISVFSLFYVVHYHAEGREHVGVVGGRFGGGQHGWHKVKSTWIFERVDTRWRPWPTYSDLGRGNWNIWIPLWPLAVVSAGFAFWLGVRRRVPSWRCARCGYDLTGAVSALCPECGQTRTG
jgi:hypothetical protein